MNIDEINDSHLLRLTVKINKEEVEKIKKLCKVSPMEKRIDFCLYDTLHGDDNYDGTKVDSNSEVVKIEITPMDYETFYKSEELNEWNK